MKKYDIPMMETAIVWSKQSYCKRAKVGAVIAKDGRIISVGYNGTPAKFTKKIDKQCELCKGQGFDGDKPCYKCGGQRRVVEVVPDNDCEEEVVICKSKCCDSDIYELGNLLFCSKCQANIGTVDKSEFLERWVGDFTCKSELKTDHSRVIHAEANAILFAAKNGISTNGCDLYVTLSPCAECAKMIIQSGIKRVVYLEKYRDAKGLELLVKAGVEVEELKQL